MKTFLKILAAFLVLSIAVFPANGAEPLRVQNFEGGLGLLRLSHPLNSIKRSESNLDCVLLPSSEVRFNFPNTPWDIGVLYSYMDASYSEEPGHTADNESVLIGVCSHYNLRQGRKVNPFFGLATGVAIFSSHGFRHTGFAVEPRIGVEFVHHIRLSLECQISRKHYNAVGLTLGFVIGGRPKKTK